MGVQRRKSALVTLMGSSATTTIAALQALVLLPLYLDVLGPRLYGAWLATGEAFVWMLAFDFGIPNLLIQRTGAMLASGDKRGIGQHFGASLAALFVLAALVCGLVWAFAPVIASMFGGGDELGGALRMSVFAVGATLIGYGFVGLSRGLQDTVIVQGFSLGGTIASFAVTAWMLVNGFGIEALATGLVVRGASTLCGGLVFVGLRVDRSIVHAIRPTRAAFKDIAVHCPPMFAAGISYALMNNSSITLAALLFRPEAAALLGVMRKAADLVRGVLDMIGHASYGGFAHLFAIGDKERSIRVYRELGASFSLVAVSGLCAYVAVNGPLIEAWVGGEMYGGLALTIALAISAGLGAWSYMQIVVWRSQGSHNQASAVLFLACVVRLSLMVALAVPFGVIGLIVASAASSLGMGLWVSGRVWRGIGLTRPGVSRVWIVRSVPCLVALAVGAVGGLHGWVSVLAAGGLVAVLSSIWLVCLDPGLQHYRVRLGRRLSRGVA
jgi:O-antigen/teichoic acid export membrane protein